MADETASQTTTCKRPSILMLLMGFAALIVSAISLAGPTSWAELPSLPFGWIAVGVAVLVGLGLITSPRRRRRRSTGE